MIRCHTLLGEPRPFRASIRLVSNDAVFSEDYYRRVADLVRENFDHIDAGEELVNRIV